jgi:hypothetical protein
MPFRHPDRSHDLATRLEHEVRERLEEAIDFVCLDALVRGRRVRDLPAPVAGNATDRAEYAQHVLAFLRLLEAEVPADDAGRRAPAGAPGDEEVLLLAAQVARARALPDYWQRFETLSARYLAEPAPSGGERRGMLRRLFSRG